MLHELKILPEYYKEVVKGNKTFELRLDDRRYKKGDSLLLKEYKDGNYTGNDILRHVTYVLKDCEEYGLKPDFVILGMI